MYNYCQYFKLSSEILLFFVFFFVFNQAFAQNTQQQYFKSLGYKADMNGYTFFENKYYDYLELERHNLEQQYKEPSTLGYQRFARLYEEYVKLFCYRKGDVRKILSNKTYHGRNCSNYLKLLKKYHPENPLYNCAMTGIKTQDCERVYRGEYISQEINFDQGNKEIKKFEDHMAKMRRDDLKIDKTQVDRELKRKQKEYENDGNPKTWRAYKKIVEQSLDYYCQSQHIIYVNKRPPTYMLTGALLEHEKYVNDDLYQTVYQLIHDPERLGNLIAHGKLEPEEAKFKTKLKNREDTTGREPFEIRYDEEEDLFKPNPFWRVRSIDEECFDAILVALKFNNHLPKAICNFYGKHSPYCYNADEIFKEAVPDYIKRPPVKKRVDVLGKF